jgi:predicted ATPase
MRSMRLTGIEARELLSFDALRLTDLLQTLVVVGPTGGGKTNLLRRLQIVTTTGTPCRRSNQALGQIATPS